jgi:uncharacterized protein (TIGR03437 family)
MNTTAGGGSDDGIPAVKAHLPVFNSAILVDSSGSTYFPENSQIRKITPDGILHTIAGTGITGFSGDGGAATSAQLAQPGQVAIDGQGNLFFSDNGRIRRISLAGIITTIAGNGLPGTSVTDGPALSIPVDFIDGIAADSSGNVYIAEPLQGRIRKITPDGNIALFAGPPGGTGSDGDGGPAALAHLLTPILLGIDSSDNIYLEEGTNFLGTRVYTGGNLIRKISSSGIISTFAGTTGTPGPIVNGKSAIGVALFQVTGAAVNSSGTVFLSVQTGTALGPVLTGYSITPDSTIHQVPSILGPVLGADKAGNAYYSQALVFGYTGFAPSFGQALYMAPPSRSAMLVAGGSTYFTPDGAIARGSFIDPAALAVDPNGNLIFAESGSCLIRRILSDGTLQTLAGTGNCSTGFSLSGGSALSTDLAPIQTLACAPDGTIYFGGYQGPVANAGGIYRLSTSGQISEFLGSSPSALAVDSKGNIFTDFATASLGGEAEWFSASGAIEGSFQASQFFNIHVGAIALDASNDLFLFNRGGAGANLGLEYIMMPPPAYNPSSFPVGLLNYQFPAYAAAVDSNGNLYVNGDLVTLFRSVKGNPPASIIGIGGGFYGDEGAAQSAAYNTPGGIASGANGNVFFIDRGNFRIRSLSGSLPAVAPSILANGVVNSASYKGGAIAAGELVSIFGSNLAPATAINGFPNNLLPKVAGNTRVLFNQIVAPILAATPGQINAIVPFLISGSSVSVQVEVDGVLSPAITIPVASAAPGLFTADASGSGSGAIVNQDGTINSAANPAPRGSVVSLYGTGAGGMNPQLADGYLNLSAPFGTITLGATATVAGQNATVLYAGGAPFLVSGAFQMNVQLPTSTAPGSTDLAISIASVPSNHVVVWTK